MGIRDENLFGLIDNISDFLNDVLFLGIGVNVKSYEKYPELLDLKKNLKRYLLKKEFQKGADFIFGEIEKIDMDSRRSRHDILRLLYWFFFKLNLLSEDELKKGNYSRHDILLSMQKIDRIVRGEE